jgi:hypothetical protein
MMTFSVKRFGSAIFISLVAATAAHAGRSCEESRPSARTIEQGLSLAEQTMNALDASGHKVVVIARAGQDLSKYGLRYSHLGFAYRISDGNGRYIWRVIHKLNHCGTNAAALYRQGLGEFFLDDLWRYEGAYLAPSPEIQEYLYSVLKDDWSAARLHHRPYSVVSYAWGTKYQQSNQWALEALAAAIDSEAGSREEAQKWLQNHGYRPSVLKIDAMTRLGARLAAENVAFDDHPPEKRFSDRIETVTVDSVFYWLERSGMGSRPVIIRANRY